MADSYLISIIFLIAAVFAVLFIFLTKKSNLDKVQNEAIRDLERRIADLFSNQSISLNNQLKEIRGNVDGSSRELHQQIRSFTQGAVQITEQLKQIQEQVKDVSSFQEIFRSPKLRGQWGEASLEHILGQHFPRELYKIQHLFSSGEQVDAILKLPNGRILPIDSKFPSDNFRKMAEASSNAEKVLFRKKFLDDVKIRIEEITSKYVLPSEGTVEFALMYIPAEAIYYEIINNISSETDIAAYAWSKKVILTSPNTIYLTLRTIEHWFKDTQVSKRTQEILKKLGRIHLDAKKLGEDFRKLGSHLKNASSAYDTSEKRLSLFGERVEKLLETDETKKLKNGAK